ncbi:MAG: S1 RNA-binding domain-containing protein [Candidatus Cloacimonas sp.]|nr:S1 RNA-binding domain-containing protein [Candidatus Cloacimonadota bacterium]
MPTDFVNENKQNVEQTQADVKVDAVEPVEGTDTPQATTEDFSQMLDETFIDCDKIVEGDVVVGKVIAINDKYIFASLGGKNEAYAEREDYQTKSGKLKLSIGDEIRGFVIKKTDTDIVISKSLNRKYVDKGFLRDAFEKKVPVTGKIVRTIKGGFSVDILGARAFCPFSQADIRYIADPQEMIGQTYDFEITEVSSDLKNIILSRRALLEKEAQELKDDTLKELEVGSVVKGIVSRIADFGVFVDLGGVDGLLHISQLSWVKVDNPRDIVKSGEEIEVKVIGLDGEKISLSLKELFPDPMIAALEELQEGDNVKCRILRNETFGSFCEIKPGVEGLIPISEMLRGSRVNNPSDVVSVGDYVEAQIIRINRDERKISLSLKALQEDPWDNIEQRISEGETFEGRIESYTNFGLFVNITDGLTGLLPKSRMSRMKTKFSEQDAGNDISLRIAHIDKDKRRISLEPLDDQMLDESEMPAMQREPREERRPRRESSGEKADWKKYVLNTQEVPEDNPFANL